MAGRKSVKRGGKKHGSKKRGSKKRGSKKRSGKKTYKRYIKKGGYNSDSYKSRLNFWKKKVGDPLVEDDDSHEILVTNKNGDEVFMVYDEAVRKGLINPNER
jgi:hypothetical protein